MSGNWLKGQGYHLGSVMHTWLTLRTHCVCLTSQPQGKAEAVAAKTKGAGSKPLPKRGDVLKRIVKDIKDTLTGCVLAPENSLAAPDH